MENNIQQSINCNFRISATLYCLRLAYNYNILTKGVKKIMMMIMMIAIIIIIIFVY
jgi:hypothetical protein